jgi:hypothetical protein
MRALGGHAERGAMGASMRSGRFGKGIDARGVA